MTANTWTQLLGIILQVGAGVFILVKGWQSWLDYEYKKTEKNVEKIVKISDNEIELAKFNSLTSSQVADIFNSYKEVIGDLEEIKVEMSNSKLSSEERDKQMIKLINKIEHIVEQQTQNFTEFLMGKAK